MSSRRNDKGAISRRSRLRPSGSVAVKEGAESVGAFDDTSRAEYVYQHMREALRDGRFQQGDRIREGEIAKSLGVSRTPVREALRRLQTRGLLDFGGGRGLGVVELSRTQVRELYAMRELLEGAAARLAAQHATPTEVTYMRHLLDESRSARDPQRLAMINLTFHRAIHVAAHNRYVVQSLNDLSEAMSLLRGTTYSMKGRPESADVEHRAILDAIEKGNPDAAETGMRAHIRKAQDLRMQMMQSTVGDLLRR